jgi:hypothetical protein
MRATFGAPSQPKNNLAFTLFTKVQQKMVLKPAVNFVPH